MAEFYRPTVARVFPQVAPRLVELVTAQALISRRLAYKVQSRLQVILGRVELDEKAAAIKAVRELADLIDSHIESREHELERERLEHER